MLGPMDEYPVHQVPQPIAWPGSSDRNFYDRSYFNAHDRTGDIFVISGIGQATAGFVVDRFGARPVLFLALGCFAAAGAAASLAQGYGGLLAHPVPVNELSDTRHRT